jgi:hypothetical protein
MKQVSFEQKTAAGDVVKEINQKCIKRKINACFLSISNRVFDATQFCKKPC